MTGLTATERETMVTMNDGEPFAQIWTAQRKLITRLTKNPAARLIESGTYGTTAWASFEISRDFISFRSRQRKPTRTSGQGFRQQPGAHLRDTKNGEARQSQPLASAPKNIRHAPKREITTTGSGPTDEGRAK